MIGYCFYNTFHVGVEIVVSTNICTDKEILTMFDQIHNDVIFLDWWKMYHHYYVTY